MGYIFGGGGGGGTPGDAPGGAAGGSLAGTYPNPTIAAGAITTTEIADATIVTGDLSATAGITSGQLAGSIAPSKVTGTAITAADTGTVTSTMLLDGTIVNADVNASAAIAYSKLSLASGLDLIGLQAAQDGFIGWNNAPYAATLAPTPTSLTEYITKLRPLYAAGTPVSVICGIATAGASLTTIASATVTGTQTAPSSGAWSLTTSSVGTSNSVYSGAGVATIGSQVVAYSAWSSTTMTVQAGGYTPSASFSGGAAITANTNCLVLYDSSGNYLGACVDQTSNWTTTGEQVLTIIPTQSSLAALATPYVGFISTGSTTAKPAAFSTSANIANAGPAALLTGANKRWGTSGTSQKSAMSAVTPSGFGDTTLSFWAAIA